eukprot:344970_1
MSPILYYLIGIVYVNVALERTHQKRTKLIHPNPKDATTTLSPNPEATNPCGFVLYKQCNSTWGSQPLGTSKTNTICSAGCAMSSTSMVVSTWNNKSFDYNPGTINQYLNSHNGYVDTDLIVWSAVDPLGADFLEEEHIPQQTVIDGVKDCSNAYIANVMNGEHWVLLTAYAGNGNFYVNDPGFSTTEYAYSGMGKIVEYHQNASFRFVY